MKAAERRQLILERLDQTQKPLSASYLAKELGVSRQAIVGDVALLRANHHGILSTHRGYLLEKNLSSQAQYIGKIACQHGADAVEKELALVIELGGKVMTVEVDHPIYGTLSAPLQIGTQDDIQHFMSSLERYEDALLSSLTQGIHVHTIACETKDQFDNIRTALEEANIAL